MTKTQAWIHSFRLRTLPLSLSGIILGGFLAALQNTFNILVLVMALFTTLFLQILSNLANDYGDFKSGVDNHERVGPKRAMQKGVISPAEMKKMMIVFVVLSLFSGISLLFAALGTENILYLILFLILGIAAIIAAIKYTAGSNPYGYKGFGDIFVFLFFGIAGVAGSYYLISLQWNFLILLPAAAIGLFSTGVLNINNMRDLEADKKAGKNTIPVRLGSQRAKKYHNLLIYLAWTLSLIYLFLAFHSVWNLLAMISIPLFLIHIKRVNQVSELQDLDPELKRISLSTLAYALTFGLAMLL